MFATFLQVVPSLASFSFVACLWLLLLSFLWSLWSAFQQGWAKLQRLHQVPCSGCTFFTGEYNLKCTVHPCKALHEEAIDCPDYKSAPLQRAG